MARSAQIHGPASSYALESTLQVVTGMTITKFFGRGQVLALWYASSDNATGGATTVEIEIRRNGVAQMKNPLQVNAPIAAPFTSLSGMWLFEPLPGQQTFALFARGSASFGDVILKQSAVLILIELPAWAPDDLTVLT